MEQRSEMGGSECHPEEGLWGGVLGGWYKGRSAPLEKWGGGHRASKNSREMKAFLGHKRA